MNPCLAIILGSLLARYGLDLLADSLNLRCWSPVLPDEFRGCYDAERYRKAQLYLRDSTRFGFVKDSLLTTATVLFVVTGGFNAVDRIARLAGDHELVAGTLFVGLLGLLGVVVNLPFAAYDTFVLEARYGFNRTTVRTFLLDHAKSLALGVALGGPLFAAVVACFLALGPWAWLWCWGLIAAWQLLVLYFAPVLIMPLFNRFTPLEPGPLREALEAYAAAQQFGLRGVFTMDGSRRSARGNAFFTGFGRSRRIVLYDTLIARHTVPELVAVVAHELGHDRRRHIPRALVRGILLAGLSCALLARFIGNPGLFAAFGMEHISVYASLIFFGFLFAPFEMALGIVEHALARRHEREADAFAAATTDGGPALADALRKLSVDNLSNLTPHPLKVLLSYSHPPVLERIGRLRGRGK